MSDKTFPRSTDSADISDITDKGWRMMGLSMCFAIVSAFFLPGMPEDAEPAPATAPVPTLAAPAADAAAQTMLPAADEVSNNAANNAANGAPHNVQNTAMLPGARVDVAFRPVDSAAPRFSQER